MIQVSPAPANPAPAAGRNAPAKAAAPAFAKVLGAALAPEEAEADAIAVRPKLAGTGKDLPEDALKGDSEGDEDSPDGSDLPFAWFAIPQQLPVQATPLGIQLPRPANAIILPEGEVPGGSAPALKLPGAALAETGFGTEAAPQPAAADGKPVFTLPEGEAVPPTPLVVADAAQAKAPEAPIRIDIAPAADAKIELRTHVGALVRPVAEVQTPVTPQTIAASLMAVQGELPQPRRTTSRDLAATAITAAATNPIDPRINIVAPVTDAQQPALDMNRQEWMTSMIDRIDALRDSSGSRETNIRLSPDALGTVDVSIRQEGDRVHVRIHAATPEARALLAEAHPRLAELAEAKGIRLGETSVGAGAGQHAGQQPPRQEAPRAPVSAAPVSARADIEPSSDDRVA